MFPKDPLFVQDMESLQEKINMQKAISAEVGRRWRALPPEEKLPYVAKALEDKIRFDQARQEEKKAVMVQQEQEAMEEEEVKEEPLV